jgi:cation diffusion facilitator CzcD-associated flavoprotein CzcO
MGLLRFSQKFSGYTVVSELAGVELAHPKKHSELVMEHLDVVIIGAGLSGIGAAVHLQNLCPDKSYAILESRHALGGTWDLFRYPGVRSDSDMHTLGYGFKPWRAEKSIADGPAIREYMNEAADENQVREHIRYHRALKSASWSQETACWTLSIERKDQGGTEQISCNFLSMCGGYYNYEQAHQPEFTGAESFKGKIIHPQFWPENLDYTGRRVVIIGSGATAMTMVPAMAQDAEHVTMVQRSPTYVVSRPARDMLANILRRVLPDSIAYSITRFKNVQMQRFVYWRSRTAPEKIKHKLLARVRGALGPDYDIDRNFTPSYNPWDERLCLVPDGDLFAAINSGQASVVTEHIDCITESGLRLESGKEIEADIIVTATGLQVEVLSGVSFYIDDEPVKFPETYTYKGMMCSGVPNLVQTFGYVNASWTLRADLTAEFVCRVLNRMDKLGVKQCTPQLRAEDQPMAKRPWIDDFSPGYLQRAMHLFPMQGDKAPWRNTQNYTEDKKMIRHAPLEDGLLVFSHKKRTPSSS